ncbi:MAG: CHASE2 domain-containing protein, partial [Hyphomicrobiales bacterium]
TQGVRPQQAAGALSVALGEAVLMPLPAGFGGYTRVDARGHQFLLDFRARPRDVPVIRGRHVLDGTADASLLSGRIALIGTTSQVVRDAFALPVAGGAGQGRTYGVVLHALAADQVLRLARGANRPTRALSPLWEGIAVLAGAVLMALAMWRRRSGMSVAAAICAVSACLAVGYLVLRGDWWLPAVPVAIAIVMTAVLALGLVRQSRPDR